MASCLYSYYKDSKVITSGCMKDLRLYILLGAFLLPFQACGPAKSDKVGNSTNDILSVVSADISSLSTPANLSSSLQKLHEDRKDFAMKSGCGQMMEVELGSVTRALHPKIEECCKSSWIPQRQYILLMENFIIENGALRECLSINN